MAFSFNTTCLAEKQLYTNCIVFGLTRSGHEPTIYRTRGERANHYTTAAVFLNVKYILTEYNLQRNGFKFAFK